MLWERVKHSQPLVAVATQCCCMWHVFSVLSPLSSWVHNCAIRAHLNWKSEALVICCWLLSVVKFNKDWLEKFLYFSLSSVASCSLWLAVFWPWGSASHWPRHLEAGALARTMATQGPSRPKPTLTRCLDTTPSDSPTTDSTTGQVQNEKDLYQSFVQSCIAQPFLVNF